MRRCSIRSRVEVCRACSLDPFRGFLWSVNRIQFRFQLVVIAFIWLGLAGSRAGTRKSQTSQSHTNPTPYDTLRMVSTWSGFCWLPHFTVKEPIT